MLLDLIYERKKLYICTRKHTVDVAQLVRVPDCGSVGRGFESHLPPRKKETSIDVSFFFLVTESLSQQVLGDSATYKYHTETPKSLSASFKEIFLSVDSFLFPMIKAQLT